MTISSFDAGKTLCDMSGWRMSNLELQKILYIAHMYHLGTGQGRLIDEDFEAWQYGPVAPKLYRHVKRFASKPIRNVFYWNRVADKGSPEYESLRIAYKATEKKSFEEIVGAMLWEKSAWSQTRARCNDSHARITDKDVMKEYASRTQLRLAQEQAA